MVNVIKLGNWIVTYDRVETESVYSTIKVGGPEICGCSMCKNFIMLRDKVHPSEAIELYGKLGISYHKESEVYHFARIADGRHKYGGVFHFVGSVKETPSADGSSGSIQMRNGYSLQFSSKRELVPREFGQREVGQIIFDALVPWIVDLPEPE